MAVKKYLSLDKLTEYDSLIKEYIDNTTDSVIIDKKDKDLIVTYQDGSSFYTTHSSSEILEEVNNGRTVQFKKDSELLNLMEITPDYATFYMFYINMNGKTQQKVVVISGNSIMLEQDDIYDYAQKSDLTNTLKNYYTKTEIDDDVDDLNEKVDAKANQTDVLIKAEQTLTNEELAQVRKNLRFIGKDVEGQTFTIDGKTVTASANAEIFGDYENNIAVGQWSIAEGSGTVAKGRASHAEGAMNQALADGTHVEGYGTKATGYWSHAEGEMTIVTSYASHAEGSYCTMPDGTKRYGTASGYAAHVEGGGCHATGSCSHAEGLGVTVSGSQSHGEGRYTIAASGAQHVEGVANIEDANNVYIHIAGNGTSPTDRSNAYTLDWNGNGWYAGTLYVGGTSIDDASEVALKSDFENIESITVDEIHSIF